MLIVLELTKSNNLLYFGLIVMILISLTINSLLHIYIYMYMKYSLLFLARFQA